MSWDKTIQAESWGVDYVPRSRFSPSELTTASAAAVAEKYVVSA